jgi:serine/threonine-protein phosphatase 2A regulatory subunit B
MNIDPSESSNIPPQLVTNGLPADKGHDYLSKDFSFPPGGIPSLRLPVVVVLDATFFYFLFGCQMK